MHTKISERIIMLLNCDLVFYCMDFGLTKRVGNLLKESYDEIKKKAKPPRRAHALYLCAIHSMVLFVKCC
jgi:hypothetical protein